MDFLYQKYEIEYEENMSPLNVIQKVQQFLLPKEQTDDYISKNNEESYNKFCLYRSKSPDFKGAKFVTKNIKPEECDYKRYQFYIFRPYINVYLRIYIVHEGEEDIHKSKAFLKLIYPIKKKVKLLKNYLKEKLQILTAETKEFKDNPINGFTIKFINDSHIFDDEEYIEQWMNGKEIFLIINPENNISQNYFMPGRFYYIHYDPSTNQMSNITESLDETSGFTLSDTRKKLIRKHQDGKNFLEENVLITFNSIMQTDQFGRLDDLLCDNDFYQFVVIFESSEININPIPESFEIIEKRMYNDIPIPNNGRPNVIHFEIAGEQKLELKQIDQASNIVNSIDHPIESTSENITTIKDNDNNNNDNDNNNNNNNDNNININNDNDNNNDNNNDNDNGNNNKNISDKPKNDKTETVNNNENNKFIEKPYIKENNIEPYIEEEEEINDDNEINNYDDSEKLLDMFSFYFLEFSKEKQLSNKKTPNPTYFNNLSNEQINLMRTFKKYYNLYRNQKH